MPNTTGALILPYPTQDGTAPANIEQSFKALADAVAAQAPGFLSGTRAANQPGPGRRLIFEAGVLYIDVGNDWVPAVSVDLSPYATTNSLGSVDSAAVHKAGAETVTGSKNFTGGLQDRGAAVFSPNNLPPPSGAMIAQTIRGVMSTPYYAATFTIPAVNIPKAQMRMLGGSFISGSFSLVPIIRLVNSTTIEIAYLASYLGGVNSSYTSPHGGQMAASYEITEWT